MASLAASYSNVVCIEVDVLIFHLSFQLEAEITNKIFYFIALLPWNRFSFVAAAILILLSARAEIPFRLHEIISDFQARLAGLILAQFELRPGLNPFPM